MEIMIGARPGGGGGVNMNKKISCGGNSFPYEGIFFYVGANTNSPITILKWPPTSAFTAVSTIQESVLRT